MDFISSRIYDAYATACAGRAGLRVVWDDPKSVPRTDGSVIYLPRLTMAATAEDVVRLRYLIKHETSHVVHSDFEELRKRELPVGSKLGMVVNMIEDMRVDYLNDREYKGDVAVVEEYTPLYISVAKERMATGAFNVKAMGELAPLFTWVYANQTWYANHYLMADFFAGVPTENTHHMDLLLPLTSRLLSVTSNTNTQDVWQLAEEIVSLLWPKKEGDAPEEEEKEVSAGSADGEGDGESIPSEDEIATVFEQLMPHKHDVDPTNGSHLEFRDECRTHKNWTIPAASDYVERLDVPEKAWSAYSTFNAPRVQEIVQDQGKPLANRLRIHLQTMARDRYTFGQRKGKLHAGSLHRVLSDNQKFAERVFKQRVTSNTLDTSVMLLVDCSGSMCGSKFTMAGAAAMTMSEALSPLHISHSIVGYTTSGTKEQPHMLWFKHWNQNVPPTSLINKFVWASDILDQNADGDSVAYAYQQCMRQKETRKILLVFSDGSPCGRDWAGDGYTYLKKVCGDIETAGNVELYGIGIEDTNVTRFYKNNAVISNANELTPKLMEILSNKL